MTRFRLALSLILSLVVLAVVAVHLAMSGR